MKFYEVFIVNAGTKNYGRVYAQVGALLLHYEGEIEETPEKVRVFDVRSGSTIDLNRDAVKQIVWRNTPRTPPSTASTTGKAAIGGASR